MATNIYKVITYDKAVQMFIDHELPVIQKAYEEDGITDRPARNEGWHNFVNMLWENKEISDWQTENWTVPDICG